MRGEYKLSSYRSKIRLLQRKKNFRYLIIVKCKKISIAIDAMGGDNSPDKTIEGIKLFLDNNKSNNDFLLNIFEKKIF